MGKLIGCAAALLVSTSLAHADWQYAKWGMSSQQLIAASKGEAKPPASNQGCAFKDVQPMAAIASKRIGEWSFEVVFCGSGGRLKSVALEPKPAGGSYHTLRAALLAKYGQPISDDMRSSFGLTAWLDAKGGNLIRLIRVSDLGRIEYRAVPSGL